MKKVILFLSVLFSFTLSAQRLTLQQVKNLWEPRVFPSAENIDSTWNAVWYGGGSLSGTTGKYLKFLSAGSAGDALLSESGRYVILPSGKRFGDTDTTKAYISFGSSGTAFACVSTSGSFTTSAATSSSRIAGTSISNTAGTSVTNNVGTSMTNNIGTDLTNNISGNQTTTVTGSGTTNIGVNYSQTVTGNYTEGCSGTYTGSVGGNAGITFNGTLTENIAGNFVLNPAAGFQINATASVFAGSVSTVEFIASNKTINTTAGDSATINGAAGRFRKDATGATFTLTDSYISANSIIMLTPANAALDATAVTWTVSAGSGTATITFGAAPTANFDMNFIIVN